MLPKLSPRLSGAALRVGTAMTSRTHPVIVLTATLTGRDGKKRIEEGWRERQRREREREREDERERVREREREGEAERERERERERRERERE